MVKLNRAECFADARLVHNQHGRQTMEAVYAATGVSASMIKDLEDDKKDRSVGYDKILTLAKHYGVSVDFLLGLSAYPRLSNEVDIVCKYTGLSKESVEYLAQLKESYNDSWPMDCVDVIDAILETDKETNLLANISLLFGLCLGDDGDSGTVYMSVPGNGSGKEMAISSDDIYNMTLAKIESSLLELRNLFEQNIRLAVNKNGHD